MGERRSQAILGRLTPGVARLQRRFELDTLELALWVLRPSGPRTAWFTDEIAAEIVNDPRTRHIDREHFYDEVARLVMESENADELRAKLGLGAANGANPE